MPSKEFVRDLKRTGLEKQYKSAKIGMIAGGAAFVIAIILLGMAVVNHTSKIYPIVMIVVFSIIFSMNITFYRDIKKQTQKFSRSDRKKGFSELPDKELREAGKKKKKGFGPFKF